MCGFAGFLHPCLLHKRFRQQITRTEKIKKTKASINKIKEVVKIKRERQGKKSQASVEEYLIKHDKQEHPLQNQNEEKFSKRI